MSSFAIIFYFGIVLAISLSAYSRKLTQADFIIGSRSLGYWVTALATHASDMSNWMFMAYPALIFSQGLFGTWVAIGLLFCMFLNWHFIAPKVRVETERVSAMTLASFFQKRFNDGSGAIHLFTAISCFFFYSVYISAGLIGMGMLIESLLGFSYHTGILLSLFIVIPYLLIGGYLSLARVDFFQGLFLLAMILFVPIFLMFKVGIAAKGFSLVPNFSSLTFFQIISMVFGWGLGYFGQPALITKFMGIKHVGELSKSKWIGMSWMTLALGGATLVGLVGTAYFLGDHANPQLIFVEMVKNSFHPFLAGIILCAVIAAAINVMCSQLLVLSSTFAEDLYKKLFRPSASSKECLWISRLSILGICAVSFFIAYFKISTIYQLVFYAWSGLGASFGPVLLFALYSKKTNKYGAWAGILTGGLTAGFWPSISHLLPVPIDPMVPGFCLSCLAIWSVSYLSNRRVSELSQA